MKLQNQFIVLGLIKSGRYSADAANGEIFSNIGRERRKLSQNILPNGYHQVGLDLGYGVQIQVYVHHFIYLHVYGAFNPKYVIDHKNDDTHKNQVNSLQCITPKNNLDKGSVEHRKANKHKRPRLPEDAKQTMVLMFKNGDSFAKIGDKYGCTRYNASVIIRNRLGKVSAYEYRDWRKAPFTQKSE